MSGSDNIDDNSPENLQDDHRHTQDDIAIARLLGDARRKLVGIGTRSRLIHVNRKNARANALNIVNERSDEIFKILIRQSKKMHFRALKEEDDDEDDATDTPKLTAGTEEFDKSRYTDNKLECMMTKDGLQKRLLRLAKEAETLEQEQGINILFLALGFLRWFEAPSSSDERNAPLILLPVALVRNAKTATYDIEAREDEIAANLPIQERLKSDFGIEIPEIDNDDSWSPTAYFDAIEKRIERSKNWSIDRDGMQLGFFSFAKLLMQRDLEPENWSKGKLTGNVLIKGLLKEGFETEPPLFGSEDKLDEKLSPADIIQVVDADASQTKVIEEVRAGKNLVVQGPPGTGKSQTITNIIASAVYDGKTVLFMAEKMAALSVVKEKLEKHGLAEICLELHSRKANKKAVLGSVKQTLSASRSALSIANNADALKQVRDRLNAFAAILDTDIGTTGEKPFTLMGIQSRLLGKGVKAPQLACKALKKMEKQEVIRLKSSLDDYQSRSQTVGGLSNTPLAVISNIDLEPTDIDRAKSQISKVTDLLAKLYTNLEHLHVRLGLKRPLEELSSNNSKKLVTGLEKTKQAPDILSANSEWLITVTIDSRLKDALAIAEKYVQKLRGASEHFIDDCWTVPLFQHRSALLRGARSFWSFSRWGAEYREASHELSSVLKGALPKKAPRRLELLNQFLAVQSAKKKFDQEQDYLKSVLGDAWRGERTDFAPFLALVSWLMETQEILGNFDKPMLIRAFIDGFVSTKEAGALKQAGASFLSAFDTLDKRIGMRPAKDSQDSHQPIDVDVDPLHSMEEKLKALSLSLSHGYQDWCQMQHIYKEFKERGLVALVGMIDESSSVEDAKNELTFARAEAIWKSIQTPELNDLKRQNRHQLVSHYQELEKERINQTKDQILSKFYQQMPQGAIGGMGVIKSEIGKKRRHKPIRKLVQEAGEVLQRIKPVFLMSPISIAQFLPPESITFDLLVIDEASQVRPEDALGAVARVGQIVVVGDEKQMPPSSFFDRLTSDSEDDEEEQAPAKATDLESILTLCQARGVGGNPRLLEWHYRSKDPSLITVSNRNFYDGKLILPPTPLQSDDRFGMIFTPVQGSYNRGRTGKNINNIEAKEIVKRVQEHARAYPEMSLGIATFSKVQQNHLTELLEIERRSDSKLDAFLREDKHENVFVKNLENVQGDERDFILISVGYGPLETGGRLSSMNFGPVNSDGGERRLNVLFTRARYRMEIFCSFDPADIDPRRIKNIGPRILKEYLEYAKDGKIQEARETQQEADSDFEIDVAIEIRKLGYEVDCQIGSSGFKIDLGVRDKEKSSQFILAVECDGATYHSAIWARERDRLRQDILEGQGWVFHRIWSTDWFQDRENEIIRIRKALEDASLAFTSKRLTGANSKPPADALMQTDDSEDHPAIGVQKAIEGQIFFEKPPEHNPEQIYPEQIYNVQPYKKYDGLVTNHIEPHLAPLDFAANLVTSIIEKEGPIHRNEIARRYAGCFDKNRSGQRIITAVEDALSSVLSNSRDTIIRDEDFYLTREQEGNIIVRSRADLSGSILNADMHSRLEIAAAAKKIEKLSGSVEDEELCREISKHFGYKRIGTSLRKILLNGISYYRKQVSEISSVSKFEK